MKGTDDKVVVIGAGMGGLAAAIRLAAAGLAVTVVEAHATPGGKMRTIDSAAGPVDAGPTVMTMRHVFDDLFVAAGTTLDAHVTLHPESVLARHWWPDGSTLDLHADPAASAAAIRAWGGPRAEADFRRFSARAARLFDAFDAPVMQAPRPTFAGLAAHMAAHPTLIPAMDPVSTLARSLARQFQDPRLRQLFGRYATYVGGSPFASPAVLALIWHAEARGVWRVEGGMHRLARAMEAVAVSLGVTFLYDAPARRIEIQSGRVAAIQLACGTRLPASRVVFNGDPRALVAGLLGEGARPAVPRGQVEPRSHSAMVWAFAARPRGPDLRHHNVFFGPDPRREFGPIAEGRLPEDPTLYICAQDRGTGRNPPELERFEIIMNAPPLGEGQSEDIDTCRIHTLRTLAGHGLTFGPEPSEAALTTPARFEALFPGSLGSLYGRSPHGLTAVFARPTARTRVPGLYLAGGGTHPGAGVPMATLSGRHAAEAILTDRTSTSRSRPTATPGGTSTASPTTGAAPSPSSPS
jgi:1-hydroxycarotenoid 3,4-desaturase